MKKIAWGIEVIDERRISLFSSTFGSYAIFPSYEAAQASLKADQNDNHKIVKISFEIEEL